MLTSRSEDVFFNSTVVATDQNEHGVKSFAKTPQGIVLVLAKKLVISIPPLLSNLKDFDLSETERDLFGQFQHGAYYTGLLRNAGIPDNVFITGIGEDTPYNLPPGTCLLLDQLFIVNIWRTCGEANGEVQQYLVFMASAPPVSQASETSNLAPLQPFRTAP